MASPQKLIQSFAITTSIIHRQADGLTADQMLLQLPFRGNCFNWVLGHVATNRDQVLTLLEQEPIFTPEEAARYKTGSDPVTGDETAVSSEKLLTAIQESQSRIEAGLQAVSNERLAEIFNEEHQQTVADRIAGLHWHETYHVGQLEILRQLAGTNDRIIG